MQAILAVKCPACRYMNPVSIKPIYDGFEGDFVCSNCRNPLDNLHAILDD
ncbi:MAG: hypothetical protein HZB68_02105 [Candidatus Aenigmarchaeota archaeon]|nr:hypothetical protein [Candidatus Aenigmarchaeota archaeon]